MELGEDVDVIWFDIVVALGFTSGTPLHLEEKSTYNAKFV